MAYAIARFNALPALLQDPPDLIFLDLIMPVINGCELCRKIRKMEALQNIPAIIPLSLTQKLAKSVS